ncbi:MAG TPA: ABC transporter permease [Clostridiaceae bacterium]|nr:ABC transporter permease [Clostridiaceae bacterium]
MKFKDKNKDKNENENKNKDINNRVSVAPTAKHAYYRTTSAIDQGAKIQFRIGFALLAIPLVLFLINLFYRPYDTSSMNMTERFMSPDLNHWFGTDNYGRDIFTRVMSGLPLTIIISIGINLIGCLSGLLIGGLSGYFGGIVDYWGNRISDALLSIPAILMGMLFVASFGEGIRQVIVALGIMFIPSYMRVVRSGFLEYRQRNFVKRLQLLGASSARIIWLHLFPQIRTRLMSAIALGFANAILAESSLSFLGLGVPLSQITWGKMLKDAQGFIFQAPWSAIAPGMMIVTLVLGSFFISNGLKQLAQQRSLA